MRTQPGGPLAQGLTPVTDEDCEEFKLPPGEMPGPGQLPSCGGIAFGPGNLSAGGVPMDWLASSFTNVPVISGVDRIVLDRTALQGRYRFALKFSPAGGSGAPDPARAELFTALQEQLGLKLEPIRAPIDVLVIDSAEKPEAN